MTTGIPSTSGPRHAIVAMLSLVYGTFLAFVVFWPSPIDQPVRGTLDRAIQELHERGVPSFVDYAFVETMSNVLLFVPVGLIFGLVIPLLWWPIALLPGPLLSGLIEVGQKFLLEERYSSVHDVIANSVGATIGVLVAVLLRAAVASRDALVVERHEALARA